MYGASSKTIRPLNKTEQALQEQWLARVERYKAGDLSAMPEQVVGIGSIARMARAGHTEGDFPVIAGLDGENVSAEQQAEHIERTRAELPADVVFAMDRAQAIVDDHAAQSTQLRGGLGPFVTDLLRGGRLVEVEGGEEIARIDFTRHGRVMLPIAFSGG